jgi:fermentation-respiration switch protein FrsA (DUF1100 family)
VMGHGFSGTQNRLFDSAGRFAEAGLAALTFDYRSFGESGGEPRQVVSVEGQLEDWRAAIRCARGLEGVDPDRIGLWGSSLGGGHVIVVAAEDPRIAAVVAQIPFNGFPRRVEGRSTMDNLKLIWAMTVDAVRGRLGLLPHYIPMVGKPGEVAVTATPRAQQHIAMLSGETRDSLWRNEVAPRGLFGMLRYRPGDEAHRLGMPVLVCVAERDNETPEELTRQIAERAPRGELRRYPGDHLKVVLGFPLIAALPLGPDRPFRYAPAGRDGHEAQFTENPASREPHDGCEGRVGELDVRQLLHGHPGPHRRGHDLDDLDGLLAHDVRAQDAPRRPVH